MQTQTIGDRVRSLMASLPDGVALVGAAKMRSADEAKEAVEAGLKFIGHNYVQQATAMHDALSHWARSSGHEVRWHCIGHLQRNKAAAAVEIFDMIETIDSVRIARAIDRCCGAVGKTMPVLLEVNSGREPEKNGVMPDDCEKLAIEIAGFSNLRLRGLMTMGPAVVDPEDTRPFFRLTRELFDNLSGTDLGMGEMRYLSMGMSDSYMQAVAEGANIVRIGTKLFGERPSV